MQVQVVPRTLFHQAVHTANNQNTLAMSSAHFKLLTASDVKGVP